MAQQKVDYQKIQSLKAKVYDEMVKVEQASLAMQPHSLIIQECRKKIDEYNNQIVEEQSKIKK